MRNQVGHCFTYLLVINGTEAVASASFLVSSAIIGLKDHDGKIQEPNGIRSTKGKF